jgi:hypothetical protein
MDAGIRSRPRRLAHDWPVNFFLNLIHTPRELPAMNSIPAALAWETFDRGRWSLPAAALGALAFPVLVLSVLRHEGVTDPRDPHTLLIYLVLVQVNVLMFGAPLVAHAWNMSRLYAYPSSTAALVTWRLLPAMAAVFVETAVWTAALNVFFGFDWPLWGPALLAAVTIASVLAAIWITQGSRWIIFALTILGAVFGMWFNSRYGAVFGEPTHYWSTVTPREILTMLIAAAMAWRIGVTGVARSRRGERPFSLGVVAWLDRLLDRTPSRGAPFRTPTNAQFWYEWRHGWVASIIVVGILLIALTIWLFSGLNSRQLVSGVLDCAVLPVLAALINGVVMGNVNLGNDLVMGSFLATRPMTPTAQAYVILRAAAASLLLAWAFWALAVAVAYGICAAISGWPDPLIPVDYDWRQILPIFAASWILMASVLSAMLTGRGRLIVQLVTGTILAYIAFVLFAKYALPRESQDAAMGAMATMIGVALIGGTIAAFVAARRRALVEASTAWAALAVWAALVVVAVLALPSTIPAPPAAYIVLVGVLALAVAPLAAAPLALAWNRHR